MSMTTAEPPAPGPGPTFVRRSREPALLVARTVLLDRAEDREFAIAARAFADAALPGQVADAREEFHRYALGAGIAALGDTALLTAWRAYQARVGAVAGEMPLCRFARIIVDAGLTALAAMAKTRAGVKEAEAVPSEPAAGEAGKADIEVVVSLAFAVALAEAFSIVASAALAAAARFLVP